MPTYEYECQKCEHLFEVFQSMTAERIKRCPECGGTVKRLLGTGAGIIFKGSGFYQTDYRSEGYKSEAKKDTAEPPAKKTESKTDSAKAKTESKTKPEKSTSGD